MRVRDCYFTPNYLLDIDQLSWTQIFTLRHISADGFLDIAHALFSECFAMGDGSCSSSYMSIRALAVSGNDSGALGFI